MKKKKRPLGERGGVLPKKRKDKMDELWEVFDQNCTGNSEKNNTNIVTELLFLLLIDLRGVRTLLACILGILAGLFLSFLLF